MLAVATVVLVPCSASMSVVVIRNCQLSLLNDKILFVGRHYDRSFVTSVVSAVTKNLIPHLFDVLEAG